MSTKIRYRASGSQNSLFFDRCMFCNVIKMSGIMSSGGKTQCIIYGVVSIQLQNKINKKKMQKLYQKISIKE